MLVALDNERLRAASLAHLRALQESRTRIVEVGDAERTRVERDLHDGAQQGLLAVSFDVRLARLNAERRGDVDQARRLEKAERISLEIVEELRRVARGVHPAILSQAGLSAALAALGDEASIPVEIRSELADRPPPQTESAAYHVAYAALTDATRRGAHEVTIRIRGDTNHVVLDMTDDGAVATEPAVRIVDRVGASGGHVSIARRPDGLGNVVTGVLPCA
jgi:signal transduction histidine kinase